MCEMFKHNLPCHKFRKVSIEVLLECKKKWSSFDELILVQTT